MRCKQRKQIKRIIKLHTLLSLLPFRSVEGDFSSERLGEESTEPPSMFQASPMQTQTSPSLFSIYLILPLFPLTPIPVAPQLTVVIQSKQSKEQKQPWVVALAALVAHKEVELS